jgi:protein SCO1/2
LEGPGGDLEDRVRPGIREWAPLGALGGIIAITVSWWAFALWPLGTAAPGWVLRTRDVCFGARGDHLPDAVGWLVLVGQPIGMIGLLAAVWGAELRRGLALAMARAAGQITIGVVSAALVAGVASVVVRARTVGQEPFATGPADIAAQLTRVNDPAPALTLTDQHGREVSLASFRGRPVIVTFAFAHCETVCPLIVSDVLSARQRSGDDPPPALVVTLDPWRDTPSRLDTIAKTWNLDEGTHVLSGPPDVVERTLNRWRVPRTRNLKTGDIIHPSIVYVVAADGRIAYVVNGDAETIAAAVRAL